MSRRRNAYVGLGVLAAYTALATLLFAETWASPTTRLVGGCCDSPGYAWFLRWLPHAVGDGDDGLVTTAVNTPEGINLMWQASVPLLGLVTAPVQAAFGPFVTYNLLATLALGLSGFTCYLALRRWVGGFAGPVVGGLLFGFSSYQLAHSLGHLNFTFVALVPVLFLAIDDVLVRQTKAWWASGGVLGLVLAGQLLIAEEVVASAFVVTIVLVAALAALRPRLVRPRLPYALRASTAAVALATLIAAYPLWVQFAGDQRLSGVIRPPGLYVQDLHGFVDPTGLAAVSADAGCTRCAELGGYLGWPLLLAAAAVAWWCRARLEVAAAAVVGTAAAVLALGPRLTPDVSDIGQSGDRLLLPWALIDRLPVLANMLPVRLTLYTHLAVALLVAEGVRRALARPRLRVPGLAVLVTVLITTFPSLPYQTYEYPTPEFFRTADVERLPRGETALVLPFPGVQPETSRPMLWQAEADFWFRLPGGYVLAPVDGKTTTGGRTTVLRNVVAAIAAGRPAPELDERLRARLMQDLHGFYDARSVVVGPMNRRAEMVAFWTALLRRPPEETGGVALWLHV